MPAVRIDVCRTRPDSEVLEIIDAVYLALRESLRVPEGDRNIIYTEHTPSRFAVPAGQSTLYTRIEISLLPGRSIRAKRALYASIATRFEAFGIPAESILVILHEPPIENWGIAGRAASDIDLGFALDV